jgi:hypothetical protein
MLKRVSVAIFAGLALLLALPVGSSATLTEVGVIPQTTPATVPSCPGGSSSSKLGTTTPASTTNSCLAVSRTTGFQVKVGANRNLVTVPRNGTLVAWTIMLGKPNATQIKFFNANEGGTASAAIAVLSPQRKPNLTYKLVAESPPVQLQPYFGKTAQFPLATTLSVKKGDVIALSVPTWAPALALGFSNATSWRASRPKAKCSETGALTTQTGLGTSVQYYCLYQEARLTYSATLISTP